MLGQELTIDHLTKNYGKVNAVQDLSFRVLPGRVTGFLGPNGAGKTTTLRMLLGLVAPSAGTATIGGKEYRDLQSPLRVVGSHLSSDSFSPGRNGFDHLRVVAAGGGLTEAPIWDLLKLVGLEKDAKRRVGGYSLGMRQRLGLAAALLGDPSVLILDEPANGLDPEGISWLRTFLRGLADEGRTVFLSSHLLGEIQQMAHDIVIIDKGHMVASGSVAELESKSGLVVKVDATDRALLVEALRAAKMQVSDSGRAGTVQVSGVTAQDVGTVALIAGVPLTHLSEETTGLEDLFLSMVGGTQ